MSREEIESRFPFLKEGEVIFLCSDGVFFNIGTEEQRRRRARNYSFRKGYAAPQKIEKPKAEAPKKSSKNKK